MKRKLLNKMLKKILKPYTHVSCNIYTLNMSDELAGKNIVITGGSSGIGKAIAERAVAAGARVLLIGRNEKKLKEVCKRNGNECVYMVCDLEKDINENLIYKMQDVLGAKINVFINNAGIYVENSYLHYCENDFDRVMTVNAKSPFTLSQLYLKYCYYEKIEGHIIFTSSNRSLMGDYGPYGMSKAAINNLIEGLARENISTGIRVNGVAPGMTGSGINGIDKGDNLYTSSSKCERVLVAEEIAEVMAFLISDRSKCITGAIIPCDGGDRLR